MTPLIILVVSASAALLFFIGFVYGLYCGHEGMATELCKIKLTKFGSDPVKGTRYIISYNDNSVDPNIKWRV